MAKITEKVSYLERMMERIAYNQRSLQMTVEQLLNEMKEFKDEMLDFKKWSKRNIEEMYKQWGHLANRMGTLVEDVFAPSMAEAIEKYFRCKPNMVVHNYYQRFDGFSMEIDILALCENENRAFVVEVKASPDKEEYIEKFVDKLNVIKEKVHLIEGHKVYPIYAALSMKEDTVEKLTRRGIYAMVVKGDILETVNMEALR